MARILVIEDNADSRELMTYLLRAYGHEVTTAVDGEDALRCLDAPFDAIVCDVHLPKLDGPHVVKIVKSLPQFASVPVVAVTALAMVGDSERLLAAGFDGYLSKPIEPQTFVREIERLLPNGGKDADAEGQAKALEEHSEWH